MAFFSIHCLSQASTQVTVFVFPYWVTFIHNVCLFVSFSLWFDVFCCVNIFFSSAVQSVRVPSKSAAICHWSVWPHRWSHLLTPSCATSKGIQLLETLSLKLYRVNPISLQRAWRKRFQFLCSWALWWPRSSLRLRTRGMPDLGTVPGLLFGLLPSNPWSHCLCAEV